MNQSNPLVSIIIPTYNRAEFLPATLNSILGQIYRHWECIIVDDGSTDNSVEIINMFVAKDPRFKYYQRPKKYQPGANGARNFGFELSKGDFIQWFDSDDLMDESLLSEKADIFINNPEYQCIISRLSFFNENGRFGNPTNINEVYPVFYENVLTWSVAIWTQSIMFRKKFLIDANERFDETLKRLHDYDFMSRIFIRHQPKTYLLNKCLSSVRRNNPESITANFLGNERIAEWERSEYIVARKIVQLLIEENKLSKNMAKYFYRDHKRRITRLIRTYDHELIELFKNLAELILINNKQHFKLFRFRFGYILLKIIPLDNVFLIYKYPFYIRLLSKIRRRIYKLFN